MVNGNGKIKIYTDIYKCVCLFTFMRLLCSYQQVFLIVFLIVSEMPVLSIRLFIKFHQSCITISPIQNLLKIMFQQLIQAGSGVETLPSMKKQKAPH